MKRTEKIRALQSALEGNTDALSQYQEQYRETMGLMVQMEPNDCYTVGAGRGVPVDVSGQLMSRDEYERFIRMLERRYKVVCMVRPLPKQREQKIDLSTLTDVQIDDLLNKALGKLD